MKDYPELPPLPELPKITGNMREYEESMKEYTRAMNAWSDRAAAEFREHRKISRAFRKLQRKLERKYGR